MLYWAFENNVGKRMRTGYITELDICTCKFRLCNLHPLTGIREVAAGFSGSTENSDYLANQLHKQLVSSPEVIYCICASISSRFG